MFFLTVEKAFHASSSFVLPYFSNTQKTHGYVNHKNDTFFDAMIYDLNILIIKMNSRIMRLVIPSLVVFGAIMVMITCLKYSIATCTALE